VKVGLEPRIAPLWEFRINLVDACDGLPRRVNCETCDFDGCRVLGDDVEIIIHDRARLRMRQSVPQGCELLQAMNERASQASS